MKKLILIFLILMVMPSVLATTYKQGQEVNLSISCLNNGTYCTTGSVCNITIFSPKNLILVSTGLMTYNYDYHNYTIPLSFSAEMGEYSVNVVCKDGLYVGDQQFNFEVTESGMKFENNPWVIAYIIALIGIPIILIFISAQYSKEARWIKTFLILLSIGVVIVIAQQLIIFASSWFDSGIIKLARTILTITIAIFWIVITYYFIMLTKEAIIKLKNVFKIKDKEIVNEETGGELQG